MTRLARWGLASLAVHGLAWLALLFGPGWVGRKLEEAPPEPALVEVVLGEGGETVRPERDEEASPAPEAAAAPPSEEPPPMEEDPVAPPVPLLPPPRKVTEAPLLAPVVPPSAPAPPPRAAGRPTVRLGDAGKPPHADLLDPENNRFRAATRDTGNRMPAYPREAALKFESGTVKLQLFVDAGGKVVNVLVVRSAGSEPLDRAAREQALTWRFTPARRDGKAVPDIVEIEIEFKLI